MKLKLNDKTFRLSKAQKVIYNLLKTGHDIIQTDKFLIFNEDGVCINKCRTQQGWTIHLMCMGKILIYETPSKVIINPEIEECK